MGGRERKFNLCKWFLEGTLSWWPREKKELEKVKFKKEKRGLGPIQELESFSHFVTSREVGKCHWPSNNNTKSWNKAMWPRGHFLCCFFIVQNGTQKGQREPRWFGRRLHRSQGAPNRAKHPREEKQDVGGGTHRSASPRFKEGSCLLNDRQLNNKALSCWDIPEVLRWQLDLNPALQGTLCW